MKRLLSETVKHWPSRTVITVAVLFWGFVFLVIVVSGAFILLLGPGHK